MHKYFWSMYQKANCKYTLFNGMLINYSYTLTILNVWSINTNTGINIHKYKYRHQNIKYLIYTSYASNSSCQMFNTDLHVTTLCGYIPMWIWTIPTPSWHLWLWATTKTEVAQGNSARDIPVLRRNVIVKVISPFP